MRLTDDARAPLAAHHRAARDPACAQRVDNLADLLADRHSQCRARPSARVLVFRLVGITGRVAE